jgi:hypothetical protein
VSRDDNEALVRRYFEAIDEACEAGNADIVDEFFAPDFVEHGRKEPQRVAGREPRVSPRTARTR